LCRARRPDAPQREKMFIQITKEKFIRQKDIIGIFDLDNSTISGVTKNFLSGSEKKNKTVTGGRAMRAPTLPKSFVLIRETGDKNKDYKIYFSSSMTGHIVRSGIKEGGK